MSSTTCDLATLTLDLRRRHAAHALSISVRFGRAPGLGCGLGLMELLSPLLRDGWFDDDDGAGRSGGGRPADPDIKARVCCW